MPSSFASSFSPIVNLLCARSAETIVDIGPGWGKYGLACREYLPNLKTLHAVEVKQGRMPTQDAIYDWVYTGDARDDVFTSRFWVRWELALFIDVIEHMTLEEGHALLQKILGSGVAVLVSTPRHFMEQHVEQNPHEDHISLWSIDMFDDYTVVYDASTVDSIICLLTS